ncbi:hypothetical protein A2872_04090 [Candidatus Gottesmanbacteria bacterium RIFCSPHIGHO2_01_FULL_42_12]|uniref:ABC-2 type transporter domain-containing protein n=1 Tax=Candidatus Gottesmanbacteria bacterium RIFCSPHIGHO2_01_FULL_42_12 TaxID=1798377 RepID=A0A1F5Z198_9BACT|nr:MAG: hypothetical protein A2872_04090 [Candidatus Gottesmanbacteria bacterium RIFCSPHIGHO2_01_FULL_42_12]
MRKYWAYFRSSLIRTLTYRGQLVVFTLASLLSIVPITAVWIGMGSDLAGGYTKIELISYYVIGLFFQRLVYSSLINYYVSEIVSDGTIVGLFLTKPVSFYFATFALGVGWMAIAAIVGFVVSVLFNLVIGVSMSIPLTVGMVVASTGAIVLATVLVFASSLVLGLFSFWTTHISSFVSLYWIGLMLFGGITFPLSFFPDTIRPLVNLNPFRFMFSFPLEIIFSRLSPGETITGFLMLLFWICLFSIFYKIIWKRGVKVYSGYGQ